MTRSSVCLMVHWSLRLPTLQPALFLLSLCTSDLLHPGLVRKKVPASLADLSALESPQVPFKIGAT